MQRIMTDITPLFILFHPFNFILFPPPKISESLPTLTLHLVYIHLYSHAMAQGRPSSKRGRKPPPGQSSAEKTKTAPKATGSAPAPTSTRKINDKLRQAVKDLGGDDEDLALIEGIDTDDEHAVPAKVEGSKDEVSE
jgi:hypothetical protein